MGGEALLGGAELEEIYEYRRQGMSLSAIGRLTGFDRKTVRRYLRIGSAAAIETGSDTASAGMDLRGESCGLGVAPVPTYGPRAPRACKLDPFKPYLDERMRAGVWNCSVLMRELRERGYTGGDTVLRAYVSPFRGTAALVAVRRFETPPGQQAQVDWGDLGTVAGLDGVHRLSVFALTLGCSRALFAEIATDQRLPGFLRMHEAAFAALGGVPQEILYDRCKTVVLKEIVAETDERGEIRFHTTFLDFAKYWGFTPKLCRAFRPQTKGKIESGVKFVRRNFLPGLRCLDEEGAPALKVSSVEEVQRELQTWLWEVANRREHGTTHRLVSEALAEERPFLIPIQGRAAYVLPDELLEQRRVARDAFISYKNSRYSVPWSLAGTSVSVSQRDGLLELRHQGETVARHNLATGPHQVIARNEHFHEMPFAPSSGRSTHSSPSPGGKERIHLRLLPASDVPDVEQRTLDCYEQLCRDLTDQGPIIGQEAQLVPWGLPEEEMLYG